MNQMGRNGLNKRCATSYQFINQKNVVSIRPHLVGLFASVSNAYVLKWFLLPHQIYLF